MQNGFHTLVWTLDPFQKDLSVHLAAVHAINQIATPLTQVQPLFVWGGGLPPGENAARGLRRRLAARGDEILRKLVSSRLKPRLKGFLVVDRVMPGAAEQASHAIQCARRLGADAIVVSRAQTSGLTKLVLGSFAACLLDLSEIPVVLAPLKARARSPRSRILFATDFSEASERALDRIADLAQPGGHPITLFHRVEFPRYFIPELAFAADLAVAENDGALLRDARDRISVQAGRLRLRGIAVKTKISSRRGVTSASEIAREAGRGYGLLAVAAQRGFLGRLLLGSTTRRLVRLAKIPLWIDKTPVEIRKKKGRSRVKGAPLPEAVETSYLV